MRWSAGAENEAWVESNPRSGYVRYGVVMKGYFSETTVAEAGRPVVIKTSAYPTEIIATGDALKGETVILKRGATIARSDSFSGANAR